MPYLHESCDRSETYGLTLFSFLFFVEASLPALSLFSNLPLVFRCLGSCRTPRVCVRELVCLFSVDTSQPLGE